MRRFTVEVMRRLDNAGIDSFLPDLPGGNESSQALQLVAQYLGRVPKAEHPVPRDIQKEPPSTREKRVTLPEPWPLAAVVVAYHITYDGHPDSYPLHIASKVLSEPISRVRMVTGMPFMPSATAR